MPGRAALVSWGDGELPPAARELVDGVAGLGLEEVEVDGATALCVPETVKVGWASLAASAPFRRALEHLPSGVSRVVYMDLQQLLEAAWQRDDTAAQADERVMGVLRAGLRPMSLSGLQSAIIGVDESEGRWRGRGVIVTSGASAGLPGLLTAMPGGETWPASVIADAEAQLEVFYAPDVLRRMVQSFSDTGDRTFASGFLSGPARLLDQLVNALDGRVSIVTWPGGGVRLAAKLAPEETFTASAPLLLARLSMDQLEFEVRDGWLVISSEDADPWTPPQPGGSSRVPFLWGRFLPEGLDDHVTIGLRRQADDVVAVELALEPRRD